MARSLEPDLFLVVSFGQIFSEELLNVPSMGSFNAHASLLPKYRGAAPIQRAILNGEEETGVTVFKMTKGMDEGPVLLYLKTRIHPFETSLSLGDRLARMCGQAFLDALERFGKGSFRLVPQDHGKATFAPKIRKQEARIDWNLDAETIWRMVRAFYPWPGAYTFVGRKRILVYEGFPEETGTAMEKGCIIEIERKGILVQAKGGGFRIKRVKPAGSREMDATAFSRGARLERGMRFS